MLWLVAIIVVTASYGNDSISSSIRTLAALSSSYNFSFLGPCACARHHFILVCIESAHIRATRNRACLFFYFAWNSDFRAFVHHHFTLFCIVSSHICAKRNRACFIFIFVSNSRALYLRAPNFTRVFIESAHIRATRNRALFIFFILHEFFTFAHSCTISLLVFVLTCFIRVCIEFAHISHNLQSRMFSTLLFFFKLLIITFTHFSIFLRFSIFIFFYFFFKIYFWFRQLVYMAENLHTSLNPSSRLDISSAIILYLSLASKKVVHRCHLRPAHHWEHLSWWEI